MRHTLRPTTLNAAVALGGVAQMAVVMAALAFTTSARAQQGTKPFAFNNGEGDMGGGAKGAGGYRAFTLSLPVVSMQTETVARMELNLQGKAAVALEGTGIPVHDDMSPQEKKETGGTMMTTGMGAALFVSRYSQPMSLAGFYWSIGIGYRQQNVKWRDKADPNDKQINYALEDNSRMLSHDADMRGTTGHMRVGYRYAGTELPLIIGSYLGVRHYQAGVTDSQNMKKDGAQSGVNYAAMTESERDSLLHRFESRPEIGVEVGFQL